MQVSEPRQDLAHNRRGQRLRQRAVPSPRRQGALQRARGAVFQDEREVAARGKGRRAADDVPVAERRQQPDLAGKGRGGSGCREREALDSDDGAREGVDGAEDLVLVERRRRGKERKRGKEGRKKQRKSAFFSRWREGGREEKGIPAHAIQLASHLSSYSFYSEQRKETFLCLLK